MQHLDRYDALAVVASVLACDANEAIRGTDLDIVDSALAAAQAESELAVAAGVLLSGLVSGRAFRDFNRRISVAVVLQLTALNGCDLRLEPVEELDELLDRVDSGTAAPIAVAQFLRKRLIVAIWEETEMYERFTDGARRVVVLAQEEARELGHQYIGTEHLLLGLLAEGERTAAQVLTGAGVTTAGVRQFVEEKVGRGSGESDGNPPFTPRAKTAIELGYKEALRLNRDYIGTEHLLLGLIREGEDIAAQALATLGGDLTKLTEKVLDRLDRRERSERLVSSFVADQTPPGSVEWATHHGRRHHLIAELTGLLDENERLREEVATLRRKLRDHGLDPEN